MTSGPETPAFAGVTPGQAALRGLCPRCGAGPCSPASPPSRRAAAPAGSISRLQRRRRAGGLPDLHRRRARRRRSPSRSSSAPSPPWWVHVLLWLPLTAILTVGLLRLAKGAAARARIPAPRPRGAARRTAMRRLPILPTLVVAAAVATMIALGIWQLQRARMEGAAARRICRRRGAAGGRSRSAARRPRPAAAARLPPRARHLPRRRCRARGPRRPQPRRTRSARSISSPAAPARDGPRRAAPGQCRLGAAARRGRAASRSSGIVAGRLGAVEEDGPITLTAATAAPPLAPSAADQHRGHPQQPPLYACNGSSSRPRRLVIYLLALRRRTRRTLPPEP